jgi:hypothetical protein
MRDMRQWLDFMRFEASSLTWREIAGDIVVRVGFKSAEEAAAFAKHFAGRVLCGAYGEHKRAVVPAERNARLVGLYRAA